MVTLRNILDKDVYRMNSETQLRQHRCCFTGHRPEKLLCSEQNIRSSMEIEIRRAIDEGFVTFITGMARGVDIWAAEIILEIKKEGRPINLICASPFQGFESSWSNEWQNRYHNIMCKADLVRFISPSYHRGCFQHRNQWMVDHSARLIAVFNGMPGGTKNTINYAQRIGVELVEIRTR